MSEVDWIKLRRNLDKSNMWNLLLNFPDDFKRAYEISSELDIPEKVILEGETVAYREPSDVVIAGMGGSAIGGDLAREYLYDRSQAPIKVVRWFEAPNYVGEKTLAIVSSYSGNTEETISAMESLVKKKCMLVMISSNGFLEEYAERKKLPIIKIPKGRPPRTALAYLFTSILVVLDKLGIRGFNKNEFDEALKILNAMRGELIENGKTAEQAQELAKEIFGRVPLIYGYSPYYSIAFRFKTQINENAKYHAFAAEIPELFHNEIMGWEGPKAAVFFPIILRGREENRRLKVRINYLKKVIDGLGVPYREIFSKGEGRLANQLSLLYTADLTSYFLALLHCLDPTPVNTISKLKKKIEEEHSPLSIFKRELLK